MTPESPFLDRKQRVKRRGQQRWRDADGERLYEWDDLHQEVEVYDKRGNHLGAVDAVTGEHIKDPVAGRTIDV